MVLSSVGVPRTTHLLTRLVAPFSRRLAKCMSHQPRMLASDQRHERCESSSTVSLAAEFVAGSNVSSSSPLIVCIHGLDNWRGTWRSTATALATHSLSTLAIDLRGHGESPLGAEEDFKPKQLVADIRNVVQDPTATYNGCPILLVGHSMGGRIALRYAAEFPDNLIGLVIEDMECVPRTWMAASLPPEVPEFNRKYDSLETCVQELASFGYSRSDISKWLVEDPPRIFPCDGGAAVWSAVSPAARQLGIREVLSSLDGYDALKKLAAIRTEAVRSFPLHVLVAEHGVCSWDAKPGGLSDMMSMYSDIIVTEFPGAAHSIHVSQMDKFVEFILRVAVPSA